MINMHLKNIFDVDTYNDILNIAKDQLKTRSVILAESNENSYREDYYKYASITTHHGRITLRDFKLPEYVIDTIYNKFIINNEDQIVSYKHSGTIFVEYSNKYGAPNLGRHMDDCENSIIVDYQLSSNIEWPLLVENKEYLLVDNSGISISVCSQEHSRTIKEFNNEEFLWMIFFVFDKYDRNLDE